MIPTITDLNKGLADRLAKTIANDVEKGVQIAIKAANDSNNAAYNSTISRIMAKHNAHDKPSSTAANQNVDSVAQTLDRMLARHNDHTYSRGFLRRRNPQNDNVRTPDTIFGPGHINSDDAFRKTMDRMMDRHNGHDRQKEGFANDEPFDDWYTASVAKYFPHVKDDWSNLPEYANDSYYKRKRIIHPYNARVPQGRGPLILTEDDIIPDDERNPNPKRIRRRRRRKGAIRTFTEDDTMDGVEPTQLSAMVDNIDKNVAKIADYSEVIMDRLIDMTDAQGIDHLREQEREWEENHGNNHENPNKGSSMAREGKFQGNSNPEEGNSPLDLAKLGARAAGASVLAAGAAGVIFGEEKVYNQGDGMDGRGQTSGEKASGRTGKPSPTAAPRAPGPEDTRPKSQRADRTGEGVGYVPATKIPPVVANDRAFQAEVTRVAKKYNMAEDDLYRVMSFESGGSFDTGKMNAAGSGATGLIQFMTRGKTWASQHFGMSGKKLQQHLANMSRAEQMRVVDEYFKDNKLGRTSNPTLDDLYMTIYKPKAVGKGGEYVHARRGSKEYHQNRRFDVNRDGHFTTDEATSIVRNHEMKGIGKYKAPQKGRSTNMISAQQGATNNINVTVNNNNTNVNQNKGQQKGGAKKTPPSRHWSMHKYFTVS